MVCPARIHYSQSFRDILAQGSKSYASHSCEWPDHPFPQMPCMPTTCVQCFGRNLWATFCYHASPPFQSIGIQKPRGLQTNNGSPQLAQFTLIVQETHILHWCGNAPCALVRCRIENAAAYHPGAMKTFPFALMQQTATPARVKIPACTLEAMGKPQRTLVSYVGNSIADRYVIIFLELIFDFDFLHLAQISYCFGKRMQIRAKCK